MHQGCISAHIHFKKIPVDIPGNPGPSSPPNQMIQDRTLPCTALSSLALNTDLKEDITFMIIRKEKTNHGHRCYEDERKQLEKFSLKSSGNPFPSWPSAAKDTIISSFSIRDIKSLRIPSPLSPLWPVGAFRWAR